MQWCNNITFTVTDISWERIFLVFRIETAYMQKIRVGFVSRGEDLGFSSLDIGKFVEVATTTPSNGACTIRVNMAAACGRNFLDNGVWQPAVVIENKACPLTPTFEVCHTLDSCSRTFRYSLSRQYAYTVTFEANSRDGKTLELIMDSRFMIENKTWNKRRYLQEVRKPEKAKRVGMYAAIWLIRAFYRVAHVLPHRSHTRVLFMSETRDYLWGNLRYIYERIQERELDEQFVLKTTCRKAVGQHQSITSWVHTVWEIARADYVFVDDYAPLLGFFQPSADTRIIQVWHAGEGFKSVGYSRFGKDGSPYPAESCHKKYTYALTGSEALVEVYEEVFGIEREAFLPTGMPRLDGFIDAERIETFREQFYKNYPAFAQKRIILFAPTFRGTGQKTAYYDYSQLDFAQLKKACGNDWIVLFKMHPFVQESVPIPQNCSHCMFDFSLYPNINELYYITDLLITDYSSNYYEYALMNKPALFFTYDREFYEITRGVHRSVKEHAPGKVCDTFDELIDALKKQDFEFEKMETFVADNFSNYDGCACDKVIDQVLLNNPTPNVQNPDI